MRESPPAESSHGDSVSIVIPVFNQLDFTKGCVTSLLNTTYDACKIVVVDNDSTDGTPKYLATVTTLTVIRNDKNVGCAPAWNQGVEAAEAADWVCVLNNDTIAPPTWLEGLLSAAAEYGLDIVSPAVREGPVNYDLEPYAAEFVSVAGDVLRPGIAMGFASWCGDACLRQSACSMRVFELDRAKTPTFSCARDWQDSGSA